MGMTGTFLGTATTVAGEAPEESTKRDTKEKRLPGRGKAAGAGEGPAEHAVEGRRGCRRPPRRHPDRQTMLEGPAPLPRRSSVARMHAAIRASIPAMIASIVPPHPPHTPVPRQTARTRGARTPNSAAAPRDSSGRATAYAIALSMGDDVTRSWTAPG
mgnify:FL=1